jgi:hypothetical protein
MKWSNVQSKCPTQVTPPMLNLPQLFDCTLYFLTCIIKSTLNFNIHNWNNIKHWPGLSDFWISGKKDSLNGAHYLIESIQTKLWTIHVQMCYQVTIYIRTLVIHTFYNILELHDEHIYCLELQLFWGFFKFA